MIYPKTLRYLGAVGWLTLACQLGCGEQVKSKSISNDLTTVQSAHEHRLEIAASMKDEYGWLNIDCDAFLYDSEAAAGGLHGFNPYLAELETGKFGRRPAQNCRVSWSRDMGMGLMSYAYATRDVEILKQHAEYGMTHFWKMGSPLDDARVLYTPNIVGMLYQLIFFLGGADDINRLWPSIYPEDLTGYEVTLQMRSIWLRGEIAVKSGHPEDAPSESAYLALQHRMLEIETRNNMGFTLTTAEISAVLFSRLIHYSDRDYDHTLAWVLRCKYSGNCQRAVDMCVDGIVTEHLKNDERAKLSHLLFACKILLDGKDG